MGRPSNTIIMTVGDIIKVTELSTGNTYEARIVSGSPSAGQVRQERQKEQLMKVAQMIYDGVKSGSYSVENVAEAIMYIR